MASTASSNTVQPISFDKADQVNAQLASLEQRIEEHVQAAARGKDKAFAEQIRAILRETVLDPLANIVRENVTVNGKTWSESLEHENQATQPVDTGLLRSTIETQDAAFQLSNGNAVKRSTKTTLLASQVDNRIARVIKSGEEKTNILDSQRIKRDSSLKVVGGDAEFAPDVQKDLHLAEQELANAATKATTLRASSGRAVSLAADVNLMQTR